MTCDEWYAKGIELFGPDMLEWKFVCPMCGYVASVRDWKEAGAPDGAVAFSCIGRYRDDARIAFGENDPRPGPCNYTGGGLFGLNPVEIEGYGRRFAFHEGGTPCPHP